MNIAILDDYQDTIRTLPCFSKVAGHHITIWNDHTKATDKLAERLRDTEALALLRERTPIRAPLLERLDKLRLISQVGVYPHIDAAFRRIPQEMAALKAGQWQTSSVGIGLRGKTLGIWGYGKIGAVVAGYGKAFGMNVVAWGRETTLTKARADGFAVATG